MHIKQVIIKGFKSYGEQIAIDSFSPRINCVVGANGSGKTNFFHATRFVLSDLFQNLRSEDKHALLHNAAQEGVGHQVEFAFVEIVFDNSDNRIRVDKEEVRLRRTIDMDTDNYFLNGRHITKKEVMNLLECAGFSRSNPYYVVQQGKIGSLTSMKDSERLDLLKEIGGTGVYEEKRRESLKIVQESGNKRKQILQLVQYLNERLKELDEEKKELEKYQQLDKQRKSLEYTIYDKELLDARHKLGEVEDARTKVSEKLTKMYDNLLEAREKSRNLKKNLKERSKILQNSNKEKEAIEKQRTEAIMKHAQLELDVKDVDDNISSNIQAKADAVRQLEVLHEEIKDSTEKLDKVTALYNDQVVKENDTSRQIMEKEKSLSILYQKQGRATQFSNKAARDKWLQKEIDDLERVCSSNSDQESKLKSEIEQLNNEQEKWESYIEIQKKKIRTSESSFSESHETFTKRKARRDQLQDDRKSLWGKEDQLLAKIDELNVEHSKAEKNFYHAMPWDIRRGLNCFRDITQNNPDGVFGPVFELLIIECDGDFTAVEVTAGNSLYHVVVENDEISTKIIHELNLREGGQVTFIPLNQVRAPLVNYPQSLDVNPLLKKLKYDCKFEPAFSQIFGRTVICKDLDVAMRVARNDGLDCITLEGDQVSNKGGMTGGFYDRRQSNLKYWSIKSQTSTKMKEMKEQLEKVKIALQKIDQDITDLVTEQQKADAAQAYDRSELEQLKQDIANTIKQKQSISTNIEKKEKMRLGLQSQIDQLKYSIQMKKAEMGTELIDHLTVEEKQLLSKLNHDITDLKEKLSACKMSRMEIETRKAELETNLTTNLLRRKTELDTVVSSSDSGTYEGEVELKRHALEEVEKLVKDVTQQLKIHSEAVEHILKELKEIKDEKNKSKTLEDKCETAFRDVAKELEQLLSRRNVLSSKQEELSNKIKKLGPLSSEAFETHKQKSITDLRRMYLECNVHLRQFSSVNKKALDQHANFTEQREELRKRLAELDADDTKIIELVSVLDQHKDESIERTFRGVARNFQKVFSELVQGGHGSLVMIKKKDGDHGVDEDEDGPGQADLGGGAEKYAGVKVKVSFTGQGETQSMEQLSGGQKTVVALALIFAIQRCDPAPFYLFDEIDAALDTQYRAAVANMIRRLADQNTQFITTTFRPELMRVADKIYAVTNRNRASFVNVVSQDIALDFIEHDQSHSG